MDTGGVTSAVETDAEGAPRRGKPPLPPAAAPAPAPSTLAVTEDPETMVEMTGAPPADAIASLESALTPVQRYMLRFIEETALLVKSQ